MKSWIYLFFLSIVSHFLIGQTEPYMYLALGDSYTIGESVEETERWPVQLVQRLRDNNIEIENPKIIATTGWTTDELQSAIDEEDLEYEYDLVSLLIGVNNQYRGYPVEQFITEFEALLDEAIIYARGDKNRVIVLSIPDYGVTPFGQTKNPEKIKKEIDQYNTLKKEICVNKGVKFFDITPKSRLAEKDEALVAPDGLHPSGTMYTQWVDICFDKVYALFRE